MTTASPGSSRVSSLSLILITAGLCLALAASLDFLSLLLPDSTPTSVDSRLNILTQLVDRGVIPLLGFSLVLFGRWLTFTTESAGRKRSLGIPSFIAIVASGLLGVAYLGIAPFHFRDSGIASTNAIAQLNRQVEQAEQQLDSQINQELNAISGLIGDENQLKQLQNPSANITEAQQQQINNLLSQIEEFKSDPNALEAKAQESRDQFLAQIQLQKANLEKRIQENYWRSSIRIPLSSLLLAIGFFFIAISGIQMLT